MVAAAPFFRCNLSVWPSTWAFRCQVLLSVSGRIVLTLALSFCVAEPAFASQLDGKAIFFGKGWSGPLRREIVFLAANQAFGYSNHLSLASPQRSFSVDKNVLLALAEPPSFDRPRPSEQGMGTNEAESQQNIRPVEESQSEIVTLRPGARPAEVRVPILHLLVRGGYLMIPIGFMSILVVACALERALGLRRSKVLPALLLQQLGALGARPEGFDPRLAYRLCQLYPSAASNVIRSVLLKVGRPQTEVEQALRDAEEREASRLYSNVRWLSLAAGVTPLLGLLGTVWGMIQAFFVTANLPLGVNRAEVLADGIYVALVTTFAGLSVAIPAAVMAHLFEGRIQKLFRELDEVMLGILPQLERFEGRLRLFADGPFAEILGHEIQEPTPPPPPPVISGVRRRPGPVPEAASASPDMPL